MQNVTDETRSRLIEAARGIFAEAGYRTATTRQICVRAKANAAAVNYYFGDKLGLYTAVLKSVIGDAQSYWDEPALLSVQPQLALRNFVAAMFKNLSNLTGSDYYAQLMAHEISHPTAGLAVVVDLMIRPRASILCAIVGKIIGRPANATLTRLCTHSIIAQMVYHIHSRPVIKLLWPEWQMNAKTLEVLVEHITAFSLAALSVYARGAQTGTAKLPRKPRAPPVARAK